MSFRVQVQVGSLQRGLTGSTTIYSYIGRLCERNIKRAGNKRRELNKFDLPSRWARPSESGQTNCLGSCHGVTGDRRLEPDPSGCYQRRRCRFSTFCAIADNKLGASLGGGVIIFTAGVAANDLQREQERDKQRERERE